MPPEGISLQSHEDILTYEEICTVAEAAAGLGINKVRITGGEPLVRVGLPGLVAMLTRIPGIDDIALTTNGTLLERFAVDLRQAGLRRVNVSLDSLRPERFEKITRLGRLDQVLAGIEAAREAGLCPVKVNTVVMRGINDDEVGDFARLTVEGDWHVRFIEHMPFRRENVSDDLLVPASEIRQRISSMGELEPTRPSGGGPAKYFRLPKAIGTIGFISPVSEHFCAECNRLRLTAEGRLRPCLFSDEEIELRGPLRSGADVSELEQLIGEAVSRKPRMHGIRAGVTCQRTMTQIGG